MMQFEALLLVGLMVALALLQRRRVVEALWIVFWAHMALASARHVPVFITVAAPAVAYELSRWWTVWTGGAGKASLAGIVNQIAADSLAGFRRTSVWPALSVLALVLIGGPALPAKNGSASSGTSNDGPTPAHNTLAAELAIRWPQDFPELLFPTKLVHDHAGLIDASRVFTTDQWGDYLIYTNPRRKVFVDGRSDFYGPEVGNEYLGMINGRWDWQQLFAKYEFNLALVPTESAIAQLLKLSPDWRGVEDDGKRILLVRGNPAVPTPENSHPEPRF
jgi:hypothetical protein